MTAEEKLMARDATRIPRILSKVERLWGLSPDLRLCQLIGNCWPAGDNYYQEDDELERQLDIVYEAIPKEEI